MNFWSHFEDGRLLVEASLWSADLTRLGEEVRRIDPFVDLYHLDVSDAHFVPGLLFFPDLIAALRPLTRRKFHVHLMVEEPLNLLEDFASAGADLITVHAENGRAACRAIERIHALGLSAGLALSLDTSPHAALPYLEGIEMILMMGTALGVKGVGLSPLAAGRIRDLKALLSERAVTSPVRIGADGGIRSHTVPELRAAGADVVVMGSLLFKSDHPEKTAAWAHSLPGPQED